MVGFTANFEQAINVTLSEERVIQAKQEALQVYNNARANGFTERKVAEYYSSLGVTELGFCAEFAAADGLHIEWVRHEGPQWSGAQEKVPDVGGYEVRATEYDNGGLLIRPRDKLDVPFILVVSKDDRHHKLIGWLYLHEVKVARYWVRGWQPPAWLVPQSDLKPLSILPRSLT